MAKLELIKNAKNELKKVLDFIKENENALLEYHDLKLHDVSYYCYSEMEKDFPLCYADANENNTDYFYRFCDCEYDNFKEDLREFAGIDFEKTIKHVGSTSKFYLWQYGDEHNATDLLNTLLNDFFYNGSSVYYSGKTSHLEFYTDLYKSTDIISDLQSIAAGDFYIYVLEQTSAPITIYKEIKAFKDNQIESFKGFIEYYENILQEEIDAETAKYNRDKNTAGFIADYFGITSATMETLKSVIYAY